MTSLNVSIILLTLKIATISTLIVTLISVMLAWGLERINTKLRNIFEIFINLPLFLSPSVLGYILILILGRRGVIGEILYKYFDISIIFSWWAGIITAFVVSFPLMYNSVKTGIASLNPVYFEAGREAGASEFQLLRLIVLPLIKKNILAGMVLAFGRAIGEFGATLMLAGNIPGKTQTISMAIYSASESGDTQTANFFLVVILIISFTIMIVYNYLFKKERDNI